MKNFQVIAALVTPAEEIKHFPENIVSLSFLQNLLLDILFPAYDALPGEQQENRKT